ncbi:MAG: glycosyltransferase family protein [Comamonadaceae bacterium]|nr:glycosyltransferase family protein [Comamonadaceae bacterium]
MNQYVNTELQKALIFHQAARLNDAEKSYKKALKSSPENVTILTNLGNIYLQKSDEKNALILIEKSLKIYPNQSLAWNNIGNIYLNSGNIKRAIDCFSQAIYFKSDYLIAYKNKANALYLTENYKDSLDNYEKIVQLNPDFAEAYFGIGNIHHELKNFEKALAYFNKAILLKADVAEYFNNRGNLHADMNHLQEALLDYDQAILLKPDLADAYNHKGNLHEDLLEYSTALNCYDKAISIKPDHANAQWNRSLLKLLMGNYLEGWKLYEWRWKSVRTSLKREFSEPLWMGDFSINNKSIFIFSEQGYGDAIQFCRYIPILEGMGARVIFEVPGNLLQIMATLSSSVVLIPNGTTLPKFDCYCPLISLPHAFATVIETIPSKIPYLRSSQNKRELWKNKLTGEGKPRIGIVWSGSNEHLNDKRRSLALQQLEAIFNLPVEFHSIQKEIRDIDIDVLMQFDMIHQHQHDLIDFDDTAALIDELDLIISVDTSVAHLAASMGKEVWILLPLTPDFRWMLDREDSPWYPTVRLFRQTKLDKWDDVISRIRTELENKYL